MQKFSYLSHTADVRIKLEANSMAKLFLAGTKAVNEMLKPEFCQEQVEFSISHQFKVKSIDATSLLIDFLSDLLTLSYTEKAIFCKFSFGFKDQYLLEINAEGNHVIGFDEDIKAITYHEANVHRNSDGNWETLVIVDI